MIWCRTPLGVDGASPAASMIPPCTPEVQGDYDDGRRYGRACGGFLDDVLAGRLTHAEQPQLDAAVEGARRRPIGQAGAFGWDRRDGTVFVAPLVAVDAGPVRRDDRWPAQNRSRMFRVRGRPWWLWSAIPSRQR